MNLSQIEDLTLELVRTRAERDYWRSEAKANASEARGAAIHAEQSASRLEAENNQLRMANAHLQNQPQNGRRFQTRVSDWVKACFGEMIAADTYERNFRFLEEALELVQSLGCLKSEAHDLVDYVFGRPVGEPEQEVGGVMLTLAALCSANCLDLEKDGESELARVWTKIEQIREKQANKPKNSPLPQASRDPEVEGDDAVPKEVATWWRLQ